MTIRTPELLAFAIQVISKNLKKKCSNVFSFLRVLIFGTKSVGIVY